MTKIKIQPNSPAIQTDKLNLEQLYNSFQVSEMTISFENK